MQEFVKNTTLEDFEATIAYGEPKIPGKIDEKTLIPGDIVSLWWLASYYEGKYIPKYFKRVYQVAIPSQIEVFIQNDLLKSPDSANGQDKYSLTVKGEKLISQFPTIIEAHKAGSQDMFNESRRKLASQDLFVSAEKRILENIQIPKELIPSEFVSIDIETTGLNKKFDDVIQLTATKWIQGVEVAYFNTYISPLARRETMDLSGESVDEWDYLTSLPSYIVELTGITDEEVWSAPTLAEVKTQFIDFIGNSPILGHNIRSFDLPFLKEKGLSFPENEIIDTVFLAQRKEHHAPNQQLATLKRRFGIRAKGHNALTDARATAFVYFSLLLLEDKKKVPKASSGKLAAIDFGYSDETPFFVGMTFVLTGAINDGPWSRPQMKQIILAHGGKVSGSLSESTDYFIQGVQVAHNLKDGKHSAKELRFMELQEKGVDIYQIDGRGFAKLLEEYKVEALGR